jgi:hypothetical protein
MHRRDSLYALLGIAAIPGLTAQTLPTSAAEAAAAGLSRFFDPSQFSRFQDLAGKLIPAYDGRPGALEANAPEFLDFLLTQSPREIQLLYRNGIAAYIAKPDIDALPPKFRDAMKLAFYKATVNSAAYAEAMSSRSRSAAGVGNYWLPIE